MKLRMQAEDPNAYTALREQFSAITNSELDAARLADDLYAAKLIDGAVVEQMGFPMLRSAKLRAILTRVLANGRPGAFREFVLAIMKDSSHEWLAKKLIGGWT